MYHLRRNEGLQRNLPRSRTGRMSIGIHVLVTKSNRSPSRMVIAALMLLISAHHGLSSAVIENESPLLDILNTDQPEVPVGTSSTQSEQRGTGSVESTSSVRPTANLHEPVVPVDLLHRELPTSQSPESEKEASPVDASNTAVHITHCEKQALQYNNTHVNLRMAPSTGIANEAICTNGRAYDRTNRRSYPCKNVDLLSFIPLTTMHEAVTWKYGEDFGFAIGNDVWGWTHEGTGREFALMGFSYGTAFVEVTDPVSPVYLGILQATDRKRNKWHDIKVKNDHAYIVSEQPSHGLQIFQLDRLLTLSASSSRVLEPDRTYRGQNWFGRSHNLVVNEDRDSNILIAVGTDKCNGGLFIMDISNPLDPVKKACYGDDGYVHDAECVIYDGPDTQYVGRELCFCFNEDTLTIVDIDKGYYEDNYIEIISRYDDPNNLWRYVHQGWLTDDQKYLLLDDEGDETARTVARTTTYVLDVSSLRNIRYVGAHRASTRATDHNQYIKGRYTYQANYDAGLRILRLDNLNIPQGGLVEEAYFDIEPNRDNSEMKGAWSVYPYFRSGTVLVSSTEEGLYIVRPNLESNGPCARSTSGCGSSLYTNTFTNSRQEQYTKIKHIVQPSIPVGGIGPTVGQMAIPTSRRRQVGSEDVNINFFGSRAVHIIAKVGLRNRIVDNNSRYKFNIRILFNNGLVASGKTMRLGASAHDAFKSYSRYVDVPLGATMIKKIEYRVIKPTKRGYKNTLLLDSVAIETDFGNVAATRSNANIFRSVAPRDSGLRH